MEAVTFISHATQSRLRTVVEKVSAIAQHRLDSCKVRTYELPRPELINASLVTVHGYTHSSRLCHIQILLHQLSNHRLYERVEFGFALNL